MSQGLKYRCSSDCNNTGERWMLADSRIGTDWTSGCMCSGSPVARARSLVQHIRSRLNDAFNPSSVSLVAKGTQTTTEVLNQHSQSNHDATSPWALAFPKAWDWPR